MTARSRIIQYFTGLSALSVLAVYLVSYILLQYSGLFGLRPEHIIRVLHRGPALACFSLLLLAGSAGFVRSFSRSLGAVRIKGNKLSLKFVYLGIILLSSGVLVSSLTRFEGSVRVYEGDELPLSPESFEEESLYQCRYAKIPFRVVSVNSIGPFLASDGNSLKRHVAEVTLRRYPAEGFKKSRIDSLFPVIIDGIFYSVGSVGYAPHLLLLDAQGGVIENVYADMKLFPPGSEDFFRFNTIPHTFFLRYYEKGPLAKEAPAAVQTSGELYGVRIARNLELILDTYTAPGAPVAVDAIFLSLGEVKKWITLEIVSDPGFYLLIPGAGLIIISVLLALAELRKSRADNNVLS